VEYLLTLQVPGSVMRRLDEIAGIEQRVSVALRGLGTVDGHEAVSGETNILILTPRPMEVFERLRGIPEGWELTPRIKAAFRKGGGEDLEVLDPEGPHRFRVGW
jgi:hypothetical protein